MVGAFDNPDKSRFSTKYFWGNKRMGNLAPHFDNHQISAKKVESQLGVDLAWNQRYFHNFQPGGGLVGWAGAVLKQIVWISR